MADDEMSGLIPEGFNFFLTVNRAAKGDLASQRLLASIFEAMAVATRDLLTANEALTYARLAAAHGHPDDDGRLIKMIGFCGSLCGNPESVSLHTVFEAEAMARVSLYAGRGLPEAEAMLLRMAEGISPEAMRLSQKFEASLNEAESEIQ